MAYQTYTLALSPILDQAAPHLVRWALTEAIRHESAEAELGVAEEVAIYPQSVAHAVTLTEGAADFLLGTAAGCAPVEETSLAQIIWGLDTELHALAWVEALIDICESAEAMAEMEAQA